ncbi:MAG: hypothetical protein NVS4B8_29930 [Herpetosiphon sp.]
MKLLRIAKWLAIVLLVLLTYRRGYAQTGVRFFPETGQSLDTSHGFLQFWEGHDGAVMLGAPITGVMVEANITVQYFERSRLEAVNGSVVVGEVGREYLRWRTFAAGSMPAPDAVHFGTGFSVSGPFLRFWHGHAGPQMLGEPLSDPVWETVDEASIRVQYFERGRLDQVIPGEAIVVGNLGQAVAVSKGLANAAQRGQQGRPEVIMPDAPVAAFGSIPHETATPSVVVVAVAPAPAGAASATGMTQSPPVASTPLASAPASATSAAGTAQSPPMASATPVLASRPATAFPAPTAPSTVVEGPTVVPALPSQVPTVIALVPTRTPSVAPTARAVVPTPMPPTPTPLRVIAQAGKQIDVNLSKQWLTVYQDGVEVYKAAVATGKPGFETPTGTYPIYQKLPIMTMRGAENGEHWVVPNVPHVMFVVGGVALHGTYWHNLFGTGVRMSHGCINLSLGDADWIYQWATVGTTVTIHY